MGKSFLTESFNMKSFTKWTSAAMAIVVMASPAFAANALIAGRVKNVNAEKKEFVLIDGADKDFTIKFGDEVVINRGGKESPAGLKANDLVSVCYDKGILTWTAHYILIKEGDSKNFQLMQGAFKSYDATKKTFTYTDAGSKDWTYAMNGSKVRLNMQPGTIEEIKIGDTTLLIVDEIGEDRALKDLMVHRKG